MPIIGIAKVRQILDRNRKRRAEYLPRPVIVKEGGFRWIWRPKADDELAFSKHELEITRIITSQVNQGDVFYDVGAHVGRYTIRAAARRAITVAFEPDPLNYAGLLRNLSLNNLSAIVHPIALSDRCGSMNFSSKRGQSRLEENAVHAVPISTLDVEAGKHWPPSFIKIDVEGHELQVLRGGMDTLRKFRPGLLIELHPFYGVAFLQTYQILQPLGYRLNELRPHGESHYVFAQ